MFIGRKKRGRSVLGVYPEARVLKFVEHIDVEDNHKKVPQDELEPDGSTLQ